MYDSGMKPPRMRFRRSCLIGLFAILPLTVLLLAETGDFDGRPAVILRNDKLELTILIRGAMLANLVLRDDPEKLSPYWNMDRAQRAAGSPIARPGGQSAISYAWTDSVHLPRKNARPGSRFTARPVDGSSKLLRSRTGEAAPLM